MVGKRREGGRKEEGGGRKEKKQFPVYRICYFTPHLSLSL